MKKVTFIFALLACVAVMTGCKKEQAVVTFKAVIDQDTKAYFGTDVRPYWDTDDQVCIMGAEYSGKQACNLANTSETFAEIVEVPVLSTSNKYYCAIFPVEAAEKIGTPASSDGTTHAVIYFPPHQDYIWDGNETTGHQRMNMPMGAVTDTNDRTFVFQNLCSILRLQVINNLQGQTTKEKTMNVRRVTIYAYGAYLAGSAAVTLTPDGVTEIEMDGDGLPAGTDVKNVLSLHRSDNGYMKTVAPGCTTYFDVVVPPFEADELNIELEMFDGNNKFIGNSDATISNPPQLVHNKIVPITLNVTDFEEPDYAYLLPGPQFNSAIKSLIGDIGITDITFHCAWTNIQGLPDEDATNLGDWVIVSAADSPMRIYARVILDGSEYKVQVATHAVYMYANTDASKMFKGLSTIESIHFNVADDGTGFQTEDVTDMSYMFEGCTKLKTISDLENSDFTNVTNMAHMFEGSNIQGFMLDPMNTHNLRDTGMVAMFKNCQNLQDVNLSTFSTMRVTDLSEMFMNCTKLDDVNLSSFNTANVTKMDNMFNGCSTLTTLDLSSFNTAQVTSMINLFNGCTHMKILYLNNFDMSNVSNANKRDMCKDMADAIGLYDIPVTGNCTVYCPSTVETAITAHDENGNYYSGLDNENYGNYTIWPDPNTQLAVIRIQFSRP